MPLEAPVDTDRALAITAMACRFPGADDPGALWDGMAAGAVRTRPVPVERWRRDDANGDASRALTGFPTAVATIDGVDLFDRRPFRMPAHEAKVVDPQQRLLLETAWEALERSGRPPARMQGSPTGVFIGLSSVDYWLLQARAGFPAASSPYVSTGGSPAVAAGRIAYCLDLRGPALTVDTACSSGLAALAQAGDSLRRGECTIAIVGAASLMLSGDAMAALCRLQAFSPDGVCRAFDANADGAVRGEGCGVLVVRRLTDALKDGDPILAVVRGWAINHDGRTNGLSAPSPAAQAAVIGQALADADLSPRDIGYLEAHGTGTALGDAVEAAAINTVFAGRGRPLQIRTVKTTIGHLEAAAGLAGVIAAVQALRHRRLPPHPRFATPSPKIDWSTVPLAVETEPIAWPRTEPPTAGVSSFGFSGTNLHAVLSGPPADRSAGRHRGWRLHSADPPPEGRPVLFAASARSPSALRARVLGLIDALRETDAGPLAATAAATRMIWTGMPYRLAVVVSTAAETRRRLDDALGPADDPAATATYRRSPEIVLYRPTAAEIAQALAAYGRGGALAPTLSTIRPAATGGGPDDGSAPALLEDLLALWRRLGLVTVAEIGDDGPVSDPNRPVGATEPSAEPVTLTPDQAPPRPPGPQTLVLALGGTPPASWLDRWRTDDGGHPDVVACLPGHGSPLQGILEAVARVYMMGADLDLAALDPYPRHALPPIASYPFQRERFWFDAPRHGP